jgi:hypothetical protein
MFASEILFYNLMMISGVKEGREGSGELKVDSHGRVSTVECVCCDVLLRKTNDDFDAEFNLQLPDGESIPAFEIEKNLLNALPCVAHAIVFGSKRSILAALLVLKSSNNSDPNLPLSSEGLLLASQFSSSVTTCR